MKHFLFGYGSLINSKARPEVSSSDLEVAFSVCVTGYRRFWNSYSQSGFAVVAIEPENTCRCNGVLIPVNESELLELDKRESHYNRAQISTEACFSVGDNSPLSTDSIIWAYLASEIIEPSEAAPILQSYLDVILLGCLEHGEHFTKEFLQTTQGWHAPRLPDRDAPKYVRAQETEQDAFKKIDTILAQY